MSEPKSAVLVSEAPGSKPADPVLELFDIQGDAIVGLQKNAECFVFFELFDAEAFRRVLREQLLGRITSAETARLRELQIRQRRKLGQESLLPMEGLNLGFTFNGLRRLVPDAGGFDKSFEVGAARRAKDLGDPVDATGTPIGWPAAFANGTIDGVFLITGGTEASVRAQSERLLEALGRSVRNVHLEIGTVRPERGHEHFGFRDGVSQPGIRGLTERNNPADPDQGLPGQDLLWPGAFVFGYPNQRDDDMHLPGPPPEIPFPWMKNGSYMVFRRLEQRVPEFHTFVAAESRKLGMDGPLLAARMVGRWTSGAPLIDAPLQDDTPLGADPMRNNDFGFGQDVDQRRCPFAAHIRKTYPRDDLGDNEAPVQTRRIFRAGIPFGPEVGDGESETTKRQRGLMFVCYQTSIRNQFEFIQESWANNRGFAFGKTRPNDGTPVEPGHDPIIGQAGSPDRGRAMDEPCPNYPMGNMRSTLTMPQDFVVPSAAAYFFMPSLSALRDQFS